MNIDLKTKMEVKRGSLPKKGEGYEFMPLDEYYQSSMWNNLKSLALKRDRYRCVDCGSSENLAVHHLSYPQSFMKGQQKYFNIEEDGLSNIVTVCDIHHSERHGGRLSVNYDVRTAFVIYREDQDVAEIDFDRLSFLEDED